MLMKTHLNEYLLGLDGIDMETLIEKCPKNGSVKPFNATSELLAIRPVLIHVHEMQSLHLHVLTVLRVEWHTCPIRFRRRERSNRENCFCVSQAAPWSSDEGCRWRGSSDEGCRRLQFKTNYGIYVVFK